MEPGWEATEALGAPEKQGRHRPTRQSQAPSALLPESCRLEWRHPVHLWWQLLAIRDSMGQHVTAPSSERRAPLRKYRCHGSECKCLAPGEERRSAVHQNKWRSKGVTNIHAVRAPTATRQRQGLLRRALTRSVLRTITRRPGKVPVRPATAYIALSSIEQVGLAAVTHLGVCQLVLVSYGDLSSI